MLKLTIPHGNIIIGGQEYTLTDYENTNAVGCITKFSFDRVGTNPNDNEHETLVEAFDLYKNPIIDGTYRITHYFYDSSNHWTSKNHWFTLDEINNKGLHYLLETL
jgi:hypothetical protein